MRTAILMLCGIAFASCSPQVSGGGLPAGAAAGGAGRPAAASGYKELYSFFGNGDGEYPDAGLLAVKGTLYGTTSQGGAAGDGTVFTVSRNGTEHILYSFAGGSDGATPKEALISLFGVLYGTTGAGGTYGKGTVFELNRNGNESVLHAFGRGTDGANPHGTLNTLGGVLYGTTYNGGTYAGGTAYEVTSAGTEHVLYSFNKSYTYGKEPNANLVALDGKLYGPTFGGGVNHGGTVFSLTTTGAEHVIHSFGKGSDGKNPFNAGLIAVAGVLYGTTCYGGAYGHGTVFRVTPSGKEATLYSFGTASHDGDCPEDALLSYDGQLYGTTFSGGDFNNGTVFSLSGFGTEHILYSFAGGTDGAVPAAPLIVSDGALYGTTTLGGNGFGTVFKINP